jgi:hypothetical protein
MSAFDEEVAHDPECSCRKAEAAVQDRLQAPPQSGGADPSASLFGIPLGDSHLETLSPSLLGRYRVFVTIAGEGLDLYVTRPSQ